MTTYRSWQHFSTQLAVIVKPFLGAYRILGRTIANENQAQFERYLHGSMGWKSSTVDDWQA